MISSVMCERKSQENLKHVSKSTYYKFPGLSKKYTAMQNLLQTHVEKRNSYTLDKSIFIIIAIMFKSRNSAERHLSAVGSLLATLCMVGTL